jgi:hypothetical protein
MINKGIIKVVVRPTGGYKPIQANGLVWLGSQKSPTDNHHPRDSLARFNRPPILPDERAAHLNIGNETK